jgi:sulfatase maturation enzyme AslB (radical SAM superfamily)
VLLTRKCNLKCNYCRLVKNYFPSYVGKAFEDLSLSQWKIITQNIFNLNKNLFPIFYGGEPMLAFQGKFRNFLSFVKFLNSFERPYAIHSNSTLLTDTKIGNLKKEEVKNWTVSIDSLKDLKDIGRKTKSGFSVLKKFGDDVEKYAILTVTRYNVNEVPEIVKKLSAEQIWVRITLLDWAKSEFYDFAENDKNDIPHRRTILRLSRKLIEMKEKGYLIHNSFKWLNSLPENAFKPIFCSKPWDSLSIDSDGRLRLCLRIRGSEVPKYSVSDLFNSKIEKEIVKAFREDMKMFCSGCNWDCIFDKEVGEIKHGA